MNFHRLMPCCLLLLLLFAGGTRQSWAGLSLYHAQATDGVSAYLLFEETPLVTMRSIPFVLVVRNADGNHLKGLSFENSLTMPAMPMPPNHPETSETSYGYIGRAIFTMEGAWKATFTAISHEQPTMNLVFDIPQVLLK